MDTPNLFDGLECYGFKDLPQESMTLYEAEEVEKKEKQEEVVTEEQFLFLKTLTCPVCGHIFYERAVKKAKLRVVSTDFDLKPNYERMAPMIYDVYICDKCGYTAVNEFFEKIRGQGAENIRKTITPKFKPKEYPLVLSIEDGIERYKLALFNAMVKNAKNSEKAFICMKIAWLYRDLKDKKNEMLFMDNACKGFMKAYEMETFPVAGLSEHTCAYLIAAFLKAAGDLDGALKWLGPIVVSRGAKEGLRNRALDLKYEISDMRKERAEQNAQRERR